MTGIDLRMSRVRVARLPAANAFAFVHASTVKHGHNISFADCAIAAIAATHGYAIATRNVKAFRGTGIKLVDPWQSQ